MPDFSILIIEDDTSIRFIIKKCLSHINCELVESSNGKEALSILDSQKKEFDLIICDLMMPEMGGQEFIQRFKARLEAPYTPILVLTSQDDLAIKEEVLASGGDDFITKPFNHRDLAAKVKVLLRIKQLTSDLEAKNQALIESNQKIISLQNELIKEESEKIKHKVIVTSLHKIRQPLTNALLISGTIKDGNNKQIDKMNLALNDIATILTELENLNLEETATYLNDIKMFK